MRLTRYEQFTERLADIFVPIAMWLLGLTFLIGVIALYIRFYNYMSGGL